MNLLQRNSSLTLALLLTSILAASHYRRIALVEPPLRAVAPLTVETRGSLILLAKRVSPAQPHERRGARLRDKGEAFGGARPDRVDASTGSLTAQ
jgi:hypothetical protein